MEKVREMYIDPSKSMRPEEITPTIGLNMLKFCYQRCDFHVWDLGGKKDLRSIWEDYYAGCHVLLFFVDCFSENWEDRLKESISCFSFVLF